MMKVHKKTKHNKAHSEAKFKTGWSKEQVYIHVGEPVSSSRDSFCGILVLRVHVDVHVCKKCALYIWEQQLPGQEWNGIQVHVYTSMIL